MGVLTIVQVPGIEAQREGRGLAKPAPGRNRPEGPRAAQEAHLAHACHHQGSDRREELDLDHAGGLRRLEANVPVAHGPAGT